MLLRRRGRARDPPALAHAPPRRIVGRNRDCKDVQHFLLFSAKSIRSTWTLFIDNDYRSPGCLREISHFFPRGRITNTIFTRWNNKTVRPAPQEGRTCVSSPCVTAEKDERQIDTKSIQHTCAGTSKASQGSTALASLIQMFMRGTSVHFTQRGSKEAVKTLKDSSAVLNKLRHHTTSKNMWHLKCFKCPQPCQLLRTIWLSKCFCVRGNRLSQHTEPCFPYLWLMVLFLTMEADCSIFMRYFLRIEKLLAQAEMFRYEYTWQPNRVLETDRVCMVTLPQLVLRMRK